MKQTQALWQKIETLQKQGDKITEAASALGIKVGTGLPE